MKKLEKSVRSCMNTYGPALRSGHIVVQGKIPGHILEDGVDRMLDHAYADVEDGVVTDIRMYFEQESRQARDYKGNSLEITSEIEGLVWELRNLGRFDSADRPRRGGTPERRSGRAIACRNSRRHRPEQKGFHGAIQNPIPHLAKLGTWNSTLPGIHSAVARSCSSSRFWGIKRNPQNKN